jgi:hypothetical protein
LSESTNAYARHPASDGYKEWAEWIVESVSDSPYAPLNELVGMTRLWVPETTGDAVWEHLQIAAAKAGRPVGREGDLVWFGRKPVAA